MSVHEHKQEAPSAVRCKVITVSDTRTKETDKSGRVMMDFIREAGFETVAYDLVKEYTDAVLLNGGTGIAERDVTIEAVTPLFSKELPGFGELFRMLSYTEDIGSAAILSRAAAGVIQNTAVFCTPGSSGAVRLAMSKLIIPELPHVLREIRKDL